MSFTIIDLGDGVTVSGQYGDFISMRAPEDVFEASRNYEPITPKLLRWINGLARMGLDFHGIDPTGNCYFKIVPVGRVAKG